MQVALATADAGSGVAAIYYSLDGSHFLPYTQPVTVDPATTPTLHVFADDHAANRAALILPLGAAEKEQRFLPLIQR